MKHLEIAWINSKHPKTLEIIPECSSSVRKKLDYHKGSQNVQLKPRSFQNILKKSRTLLAFDSIFGSHEC